MRLYKFLLANSRGYNEIRNEYMPKKLAPYYDMPIREGWKIDIALISDIEKIAIELDGPPHGKQAQKDKDENKRDTLKFNRWKVIVIDYEYADKLWDESATESEWLEQVMPLIKDVVKLKTLY